MIEHGLRHSRQTSSLSARGVANVARPYRTSREKPCNAVSRRRTLYTYVPNDYHTVVYYTEYVLRTMMVSDTWTRSISW